MYDPDRFEAILLKMAESLEISPSDYKKAVESYGTVVRHLEGGDYLGSTGKPAIYAQGSFRLGTVVRPLKNGKESDYDIDLVCELQIVKEETTEASIKHQVGKRLKENANFERMLQPEGRRCWTLEYSDQGQFGFHIDVLPCIPEDQLGIAEIIAANVSAEFAKSAIAITDKEKGSNSYTWDPSNSKGFAEWFDEVKKPEFTRRERAAKSRIFAANAQLFESIDDVPQQLVKTPLQQAIQIFKRHRDVRFAGRPNEGDKPISMIITTLSALAYRNESTLYETIVNIVEKIEGYAKSGLFTKTSEGWNIPNPVDPRENFADKWNEDSAKADAFFQWLRWMRTDIANALAQEDDNKLASALSIGFGTALIERVFPGHGNAQAAVPQQSPRPRVTIQETPQPYATR